MKPSKTDKALVILFATGYGLYVFVKILFQFTLGLTLALSPVGRRGLRF